MNYRLMMHLFLISIFSFTLAIGLAAAVHDRAYAQGSAAVEQPDTPQTPLAGSAELPKIKAALPNPETDTSGFVAEIGAAWSRGAYLTVSLLVLYGGLAFARRKITWLAQGRRAVVVAAAITALITAILGLSTGNGPTLAWAANALAAGFALYLRTEPLPAATANV